MKTVNLLICTAHVQEARLLDFVSSTVSIDFPPFLNLRTKQEVNRDILLNGMLTLVKTERVSTRSLLMKRGDRL